MQSAVLDASAFVAVLLDEILPPDLSELVVDEDRATFVVPPLWKWEIANAIVVAVRRNRQELATLLDQVDDFLNLSVFVDQAAEGQATSATIHLGLTHNLSGYDAAYLELALRRRLPLATLDRRLAAAARSAGVDVIGSPD